MGKFGARSGNNLVFISLWEVNARDTFFPCYNDKMLQGFTMSKKNGKEERSGEGFLMLMQTGFSGNLGGVGSRYVDKKDPSKNLPEYTKFEEYSFQVQLFFPETLPQEVLDYNPKALDELKKQKEYMDLRKDMSLEFALTCPELSSIKAECDKSADDQVAIAKKKNSKLSEDSLATQREVAFETAFSGMFKFGMKKETYQDEKNVDHEMEFIGVKCSAFSDNYKKEPLPADLAEFKNNTQLKPQVDMIESAYAKGKRLNKMEILNPDGSPREYGTFEIPVKSGSIVLAAVIPKWFDKGGDNRGCGYKCRRMQVIWERGGRGGSDANTTIASAGIHFIAGKTRTYYEIVVLKALKQHVDNADGISAIELVEIFVDCKPAVMTQEELVGSVETLMGDKLVVNGKDESHFKLAKGDLDVDKLPSLPKPNTGGINMNHNLLSNMGNQDFDDDD